MIYEFITPSDPITFKSDSDKVAYFCALVLGNAKAGCTNTDTGESLGTLMIFCPDALEQAEKFLDSTIDDFSSSNPEEIIKAFRSFSYGSVQDRITYDSAIEAITDSEKLEEFKKSHEDKNRTSLSKWVQSAWDYADALESKTKVKGEIK